MSQKTTIQFALSREMKQKLEEICKETGFSMSDIARRGVYNQIKELGDKND